MLFRRAPQKVEELKIVIVGAGEVGFHIAQRLSEEQKQVVVIDQNPDKLRRIEDT
ncbi:MAG: NAD-binding protein, partial [Bilophila wadsworthia]